MACSEIVILNYNLAKVIKHNQKQCRNFSSSDIEDMKNNTALQILQEGQ